MSNITLSIDDETIKQARLRAVQEGVSLSAKMREMLQRYAHGQLDTGVPDLSFAENAVLFTGNQPGNLNNNSADEVPAPLAPNGVTVAPEYLRKIRGWARADLYDQPSRHGSDPTEPT